MNTLKYINKIKRNELNQLLNELVFTLKKTYSEEDLLKLSLEIFKESGKQTYQSKKELSINLVQGIKSFTVKAVLFTNNKWNNYKTKGFKNEVINDVNIAKTQLKNLPSNLKKKVINLHDNFLAKTKDEKIELLAVSLMGILVFFASAGGKDLEGGLPDSDLNFGIGNHRHWLSHTIIMGFIVEFLMRSGVELINKSYKNLPPNHHPFWDQSNEFINKHKGIAVSAMWAGMSVHLIKDSGIFGHGVKAYTGIPTELSMQSHENLFLANGIAAAFVAKHEMKNKLTFK